MPQPERPPRRAAVGIVRGRVFVDQAVRLDGRHFERCSFDGCVLEVGGAEVGTLTGCSITRSGLAPVDAAEVTLQQLALLYADPGFRDVVEGWLQDIRETYAREDPPVPASPPGSFDA